MSDHAVDTLLAKTYSDGERQNRPLSTPLVRGAVFEATDTRTHGRLLQDGADTFYTRFGHPTLSFVGRRIARLEEAERALLFPSGMSAITTALLTALRGGDHVVLQRRCFAQTSTFLDTVMSLFGVETTLVDATDADEVAAATRPNTRVVYVETPSNPLLELVDLELLSGIAHDAEALLLVDGTFASPLLQKPLALGADLSIHSGSKFLGGHADLMCGIVAGSAELLSRVFELQVLLGGIMDPEAAWLLDRSLRTLALRVRRQSDSALAIARFLDSAEGIREVHYPWLESSPFHAVARRQMTGGGGVVSFEIEGGLEEARSFVEALRLIPVASSLGNVETMIELPVELDFSEDELGAERGALSGVTPSLVRLSVGIEDPDDLVADLSRGLKKLRAGSRSLP